MELVEQVVIGLSLCLLAVEGHLHYGRNTPTVGGPPIPLFKPIFGDWLTPREPYHPIPMINPFDTANPFGLNHFDKGDPVPLQREEVNPDSSVTAGYPINENDKTGKQIPKETVIKSGPDAKNPSPNAIDNDLSEKDLNDKGNVNDGLSTDSRSKEDSQAPVVVNDDQDAIYFPKETDDQDNPPKDNKHDIGKVPTDSKNINANLTVNKFNHTKGNDSLTPNSDIVIIVPNTPTFIAQDGNGNIIVPFPGPDINLNSVLPISGTTVDGNGNILVPITNADSGTNVAPVIPGGTDSNIQLLVPISNSGVNSATNTDTNLQNLNVLFPLANGANNVKVNPVTGNVITAAPNTKPLNVNQAVPVVNGSPMISTSTSTNPPNMNTVVTPTTSSVSSPNSISTNPNIYTNNDPSKPPIINVNNQGNDVLFTNAKQNNQNPNPNNGNVQVNQNNPTNNAAQNNQINPIPIPGSNIISQISLMPVNGGNQNGNAATSGLRYTTNANTETSTPGTSVPINSNSLPVTNIPNTNAGQNSGVQSPVSNGNVNSGTQSPVPGTFVINGNSGSQISGGNYVINSNTGTQIPVTGGYLINPNTGAAIPVSGANYVISSSPGLQTSLPSGTYVINGNSGTNIPLIANSGVQSPVSSGTSNSGTQTPISGGSYTINGNSGTQIPVTVNNGNSGAAIPIANYVIGNPGTQTSVPSATYVINGNSGTQSTLPSNTYVINGNSGTQLPLSDNTAQWPTSNTGTPVTVSTVPLTSTANPSNGQTNTSNQPNIVYTTPSGNQPYILVPQTTLPTNYSPQSNSDGRQQNTVYTVVVPNGYSSNPSNVILLSYPTNSVPGYTLLNLSGNSPLVYYKLKK